MKEQKSEEKEKGKKKPILNGEKKFYLFTALSCAVLMTAIIVVSVAVSGGSKESVQVGNNSSVEEPDSSGDGNGSQVSGLPEGMVTPVATATVSQEHGFHYSETLNAYFAHVGVDFVADAGTNVIAAEDGVVESVYKGDILTGTEIVIAHSDGLKTLYRFVDAAENIKAGVEVKKGQALGTVAAANGGEYKAGAHLHFEVHKDGAAVDPALYLTFEEK